jgi:hypothetical protein
MTHEAGLEAAVKAFRDCEAYPAGPFSIREAIEAYLAESRKVLVPREPTEEMKAAWESNFDDWFNEKIEPEWHMWNVMLDAAPDPFKSKP